MSFYVTQERLDDSFFDASAYIEERFNEEFDMSDGKVRMIMEPADWHIVSVEDSE